MEKKKSKKEEQEEVKEINRILEQDTSGIIILDHPEITIDKKEIIFPETDNSLPEDNVH